LTYRAGGVWVSRSWRWLPLAAVVALLAVAMLSAVYANPTIQNRVPNGLDNGAMGTMRPEEPPPVQPSQAVAQAPEDSMSVPAWVGWALLALCVAVVLGVGALLLRTLLRGRLLGRRETLHPETRPTPPTETAREVREALDEGLADLDAMDSDPRRVVIACWVRLERAAAEAGTPRAVGDTSTELVARLLSTSQVSAGVLDAFAAVYREARFATHTVDIGMRDQARAALTQLRDELAIGVS
jgi:hypothetical protein